jgi:tRNA threonylcarbamoyladenosine biosynthesis protein TsaE
MNETFRSTSASETLRIAASFARSLKPGQCVALQGELGAGKTVFAKGVISALTKVPVEEIPSPTFTLIEEYSGIGPIYHVDLYRMASPQEAKELAWDELFAPEAITLVEWPERVPDLIRACQFQVFFTKEEGASRQIEIKTFPL